jgi:hypothetical protein
LWLLNELHVRATGARLATAASDYKEAIRNPLFYDDMPDEVRVYTDYCMRVLGDAGKGARMYVEARYPLFYRAEDKGTIDCLIVSGDHKTLHVIDLKFGKGVKVEAKDNKQLLIYAINAYTGDLHGMVENVSMTIVQPRLDHIATYTMGVDELELERDVITAAAGKALRGEGVLKAGAHCKFCPVKPKCRAQKDRMTKIAEKSSEHPGILTNGEIATLLGQIDQVADWIASVKKYALEKAVEGETFEGYKLVAGKSNRKINDEKALLNALIAAGYDGVMFKRTSFVTLTELQKAVSPDDFATCCAPYIVKPEAPPVLVDAADPRPEFGVAGALSDFREFI